MGFLRLRQRLRALAIAVSVASLTCVPLVNAEVALAAGECPAGWTFTASNATCSRTWVYSGATAAWTVPPGVSSLTVDVRGAMGGNGGRDSYLGGVAGPVGWVSGTIAVTPGSAVTIAVGQNGTNGWMSGNDYSGTTPGGTNPLGGYAGGVGGGAGCDFGVCGADRGISGTGGGGGAASVLRIAAASIVAAGGGGGGGGGQFSAGTAGVTGSIGSGTNGAAGIGGQSCGRHGGGSGGGGGGAAGGNAGGKPYWCSGSYPGNDQGAYGGSAGSNGLGGFAGLSSSTTGAQSGSITITYDASPVPAITSAVSLTNAATLTFPITWGMDVTGFTAADITFGGTAAGCIIDSLAGSGASYTLTVSGCSDGTVIPMIAARAATSLPGSGSLAGPSSAITGPTVRIDRTAPTLAPTVITAGGITLTDGSTTSASMVTLAAPSATDASTVTLQCSLDGATFTSCPATYSGLASGSHELVVRATDAAGNVTTQTRSWSVAGTPTVSVSAGSDTGTSSADGRTSDATPTMSLTNLTPGATVTVTATATVGGLLETRTCSFTAPPASPPSLASSGSCDLGLDTALPDASWSVTAQQVSGGVTSVASAPITMVIDTTAPVIAALSTSAGGAPLVEGGITAASTLTLATPTATDATSVTLQCRLDGGTWTVCPASYSGLTSGAHALDVRATDAAGNTSTSTRTWSVVDKPVVALSPASDTGTSSTDRLTGDSTPTINLSGLAAGATVTVTATKSGSPSVTCSFTAAGSTGSCDLPQLGDGGWTISATQLLGGVTSAVATSTTVTVDTTAPTLAVITLKSGTTVIGDNAAIAVTTANTFTLTAPTATDANAGTVIQCQLDGGSWGACPASYTNLAAGQHTLTVRATDASGNVATQSKAWYVLPPPTLALDPDSDSGYLNSDSITNDSTPRMNVGALVTGAVVTVTAAKSGSASVSCTFTATGSTGTCDLPTMIDGSWTVTAVQAYSPQPSGTAATSASSNTVTVAIDTIAPAWTTFTATSNSGSQVIDGAVRSDLAPTYPNYSILGTFSDTNMHTGTCSFDGGALVSLTATNFTCPATTIESGAHTMTFVRTDKAGNVSAPAVFDWSLVGLPVLALASTSDTGSSATDRITSDSTPTMTVSNLAPGATVTVTAAKSGSPSVTCSFTAPAAVSPATSSAGACDLPVLSPDGGWSITATQSIGGVSKGTAALAVTIDTTPPTVTAPTITAAGAVVPNDGATGSTSAVIGPVSIPSGATAVCTLDGIVTACPTTNTTVSALAVGVHTFQVTTTDTAGNVAVTASSWRVIAAPTVLLAATSDTGTSVSDRITADSTPTIEVGALTEGATVTVTAARAGSPSVSCTFAATGATGACDLPALVDGTWAVTATQSFPSGSGTATSPASAALSVTIDTGRPAPPTVGIASALSASAEVTSDATSHLGTVVLAAVPTSGTTTPPDVTVSCSLNGAAPITPCPTTYSDLPEGAYSLTATATDAAGNTTSSTVQWYVVRQITIGLDPSPNLRTSSSGQSVTSSPTQSVTVTATPDATVEVTATLRGSSPARTVTCRATADATTGVAQCTLSDLTEGVWDLASTQTNGGVTSAPSTAGALTVDSTAPSLSIVLAEPSTSPAVTLPDSGARTASSALAVAVTASDAIDPSLSYACTLDGQALTPCPPTLLTGLGFGEHTLSITASDDAGNSTTRSRTWMQITAPVVALDAASDSGSSAADGITNDSTPLIVVTGLGTGVDVLITASKQGQPDVTCVVPDVISGSTSCALSTLVDGTWSISAIQRIHNRPEWSSPASVPASILVDTIRPSGLGAAFTAGGSPIASGAVTSATSLVVSGLTASDANTVTYRCTLDGGTPAPCGTLTGLTAGVHSLVVTATDAAGNAESLTLGWTVMAPPSVDLDAASDSGASRSDEITNASSPSITVSQLIPGARVTVTATKAGMTAVTCTFIAPQAAGSAPSSSGSCVLPGLATDGQWTVTADQRLGTAQSGASGSLVLTLDTLAPVMTAITGVSGGSALANGGATTSDAATLTLPTPAAGELMTCTLDGGAQSPCSGALSGLAEGRHEMTVAIVDVAGNRSTSTFIWYVLGQPTLALSSASDTGASSSDRMTTDSTPHFEVGNLVDRATVTVTATKGAVTVTCTFIAAPDATGCDLPSMSDGSWVVTAHQAFGTGASPASAAVTIAIDTVPPSAPDFTLTSSATAIADGDVVAAASATLGGVATADLVDSSPVTSCALDAGTAGACPPGGLSALASGTHTLTVTARDTAGNTASSLIRWTVLGSPTIALAATSDTGTPGDGRTSEEQPAFDVGNLAPGATVTVTAVSGGVTRTCTFVAPAAATPATSSSGSCSLPAISGGPWSVSATQMLAGVSSADSSATQVSVVQRQPVVVTDPGPVSVSVGTVAITARSQPLPAAPVALVSLTPSVCIVGNGGVTLLSAGECHLRATAPDNTGLDGTYYESGLQEVRFSVLPIAQPTTVPVPLPGQSPGTTGGSAPAAAVRPSGQSSGTQQLSDPATAGIGGQDGARSTAGLNPPPAPIRTVVTRIPGTQQATATATVRQDVPGAPVRSVVFVVFDDEGRPIARIAVDVEPGQTTVTATVPFGNDAYRVRTYTTNEAGVSRKAPIGANVLRRPTTVGKRPDGTPILFGKAIARPVLFDPNSPALDQQDRAVLDDVVRYVARNGGRVFITGFVRNWGGDPRFQKRLSGDRARNVATYLSSRGVDAWIRYDGYGPRRPGLGTPQDRRVEVRWSMDEIPGLVASSTPPAVHAAAATAPGA